MKAKKSVKILIIVGAVLLCLYVGFCVADCIRLKKSALYTQPFLTVSKSTDTKNGYEYYHGLGYTMRYSIPKEYTENGKTFFVQDGVGSAEFSWLGITIWGWAY
ncbi:MAG: hypothetical protein K2J80_04545 [Oscillospiraceae bacterium]|nr:hypothetical protein [Oscillospiraceae bacterium]